MILKKTVILLWEFKIINMSSAKSFSSEAEVIDTMSHSIPHRIGFQITTQKVWEGVPCLVEFVCTP